MESTSGDVLLLNGTAEVTLLVGTTATVVPTMAVGATVTMPAVFATALLSRDRICVLLDTAVEVVLNKLLATVPVDELRRFVRVVVVALAVVPSVEATFPTSGSESVLLAPAVGALSVEPKSPSGPTIFVN